MPPILITMLSRLFPVATGTIALVIPITCALIMPTPAPARSLAGRGAPPATTAPAATLPGEPATPAREKLEIAGETFELEVAAADKPREKGLMQRERIEDHAGMLFIYPETQDELGFWMKNCPIDIDILYLDHAGRIVSTYKMKSEAPKRDSETESEYEDRLTRYPSRRPAQFAVELKAGTIERLKIKPGQTIEMDVKRLEALAE